MSKISRRSFIAGCSAGIMAMNGGRVSGMAFLAPEAANERDLVVNVFLRGGMDALNFVVPYNDPDYIAARPQIKLLPPGNGIGSVLDLDGYFGIHPAAAPLHDLYQSHKLSVIHACGSPHSTRSHFDAMDYMEKGVPGDKSVTSGWLTRYLATLAPGPVLQAISTGNGTAKSLQGYADTVTIGEVDAFKLATIGNTAYTTAQHTALRALYTGASLIHETGMDTLAMVDQIVAKAPATYVPEFGAQYPDDRYNFGNALKSVAQLAKMDLGLHIATVDLGGWDTHEHQGTTPTLQRETGGWFGDRVATLAQGLSAFYTDMGRSVNRLTVIVQTEFGRRLKQNASDGTDHGHGGVMLLLHGGLLIGGKVHGQWPGLATEQLDNRVDLAVTTDYRAVLSSVLTARLGNTDVANVFPGFTGVPLHLFIDPATLTNKLYLSSIHRAN